MSIPLISFFLSLLGIIVMVWRELILVRNGQVAVAQHSHPFVPDLHKLKHITLKGTKKFGYIVLFVILRFFIRSSNFIKTISKILIKELKNKFKKIVHDSKEEITEKKEASKYLKIISEYQHKIRQMKHRIKEEEGIE